MAFIPGLKTPLKQINVNVNQCPNIHHIGLYNYDLLIVSSDISCTHAFVLILICIGVINQKLLITFSKTLYFHTVAKYMLPVYIALPYILQYGLCIFLNFHAVVYTMEANCRSLNL